MQGTSAQYYVAKALPRNITTLKIDVILRISRCQKPWLRGKTRPTASAHFYYTSRIAGALNVFGGTSEEARLPMLMCAMVRRVNGVVSIARAYCHPIAHQNWWCPVDSHNERLALEDLVGVMNWLHKEKSIDLRLLKPVTEWNGTCAVPDFVLSISHPNAVNAHLLIETMGYSDPDYLERKQRTMAKLSAFEVFQDQRAVQGPTVAGPSLRSGVSKWAIRTAANAAKPGRQQSNHS